MPIFEPWTCDPSPGNPGMLTGVLFFFGGGTFSPPSMPVESSGFRAEGLVCRQQN